MQAFGVVRVRDILRLMTAYVVVRNMPVCDSTRPELHGWIGGEDVVYGGVLLLSCVVILLDWQG